MKTFLIQIVIVNLLLMHFSYSENIDEEINRTNEHEQKDEEKTSFKSLSLKNIITIIDELEDPIELNTFVVSSVSKKLINNILDLTQFRYRYKVVNGIDLNKPIFRLKNNDTILYSKNNKNYVRNLFDWKKQKAFYPFDKVDATCKTSDGKSVFIRSKKDPFVLELWRLNNNVNPKLVSLLNDEKDLVDDKSELSIIGDKLLLSFHKEKSFQISRSIEKKRIIKLWDISNLNSIILKKYNIECTDKFSSKSDFNFDISDNAEFMLQYDDDFISIYDISDNEKLKIIKKLELEKKSKIEYCKFGKDEKTMLLKYRGAPEIKWNWETNEQKEQVSKETLPGKSRLDQYLSNKDYVFWYIKSSNSNDLNEYSICLSKECKNPEFIDGHSTLVVTSSPLQKETFLEIWKRLPINDKSPNFNAWAQVWLIRKIARNAPYAFLILRKNSMEEKIWHELHKKTKSVLRPFIRKWSND